ncbi:hypothetical protein N9355_04440 [Crocinitomicaceae bacterium]|nr:hypothetical protein [Crocinitomicaceae bacterium]
MSMKVVVISFFALTSFFTYAEGNPVLQEIEQELDSLLDVLRTAETNAEKSSANAEFKQLMTQALNEPGALSYDFTLLETVGVIDSPDEQVRIVNWNVEQEDFSHTYHCFVLYNDNKKDEVRVTELVDMSFGMPSQPTEIIDHENWYGALYYKIIPVKRGSKTIYTLLGWDHNSSLSQIKLIDAMYFTSSAVKFGSPIFKMGKETKKRVFFEHSKKTSMFLNYEAHRERIMMDHLSPESPALKNFRSYYVPDMSYDAFEYEGKKWVLKEDVIGINDNMISSQKQEVTVMNNQGQLEKRIVKTNWQNPEDATAPAGGSEHVAVTPETEGSENPEIQKTDRQKELDARVDKKDKRNPNDLSILGDKKKKKRRWFKRKN